MYAQVPAERRRGCWAHRKRDFQKAAALGGASAWAGRRGLRLVKEGFAAGHAFGEGRVTRAQLQAKLDPVANRPNRLLPEGALRGEEPKVAAFCAKVLALGPALRTFVRADGGSRRTTTGNGCRAARPCGAGAASAAGAKRVAASCNGP